MTADPSAAAWPTSDFYAARARRGSLIAAAAAIALACAYAAVIVATGGELRPVVPLVGALALLVVCAHPAVGVYLLFGAAILLEQFPITGLTPFTSQTHVFENLSEYTELPLRLSVTDLVMLVTLASWAWRASSARERAIRTGPFAWALAGYLAIFVLGVGIGASHGGWDANAALAELRGPVYLCVVYFLSANLIRDRGQLAILAWIFVAVIAVKAVQALINYQDALGGVLAVAATIGNQAVTSDEDVVFFNLAVALAVTLTVLGIRGRLRFTLLALVPLVLGAEMVTQRRVGFVALAAVLLVITTLVLLTDVRRGLVLAALGLLCSGMYLAVFWDQGGPLEGPIRALRVVIEPSALSTRDVNSDQWREIENRNIAYTIGQLPLTGVGVGQPYLFREEPPALPASFTYWRYITHNALLWIWLKAGPIGALAFWILVARVLLFGSAAYARLRDPVLRATAAAAVSLMVIQVVFSSVDLGLTYSRTMIALGVVLGLGAMLAERRPAAESRVIRSIPRPIALGAIR